VPGNYPLQIFGRSVGGALAAGNACVVKPAEDACLPLLRVAELAAEVGFPPGAINIVTGYGHEAGDALTRHPGIDHISFTGSPRIRVLVTQVAAARHVLVTLERGCTTPPPVFADGPAELDLDCGPLIRKTQQERVQGCLQAAAQDGIATAAQGRIADGAPAEGYYQAPTLLRDVPLDHRLAQEEVFGPVLAAMPFDDEADAVRIANATEYGLAASVWTRDGARQLRIARKVRSGQVFINNYGAGGGIELPFGGVKASGHGREKGFEALYGFTVLKTISIKHD